MMDDLDDLEKYFDRPILFTDEKMIEIAKEAGLTDDPSKSIQYRLNNRFRAPLTLHLAAPKYRTQHQKELSKIGKLVFDLDDSTLVEKLSKDARRALVQDGLSCEALRGMPPWQVEAILENRCTKPLSPKPRHFNINTNLLNVVLACKDIWEPIVGCSMTPQFHPTGEATNFSSAFMLAVCQTIDLKTTPQQVSEAMRFVNSEVMTKST